MIFFIVGVSIAHGLEVVLLACADYIRARAEALKNRLKEKEQAKGE